MAYSTLADIKKKISAEILIQLTDDTNADVINTEKIDEAISDADAEIDGYCGKYPLPFSPVPDIIKKFSVAIAIYNLFGNRQAAPEDVETRYNNAIAFLKDVSKGQATLGPKDPAPANQGAVDISSSDRVFDRKKLSGF